MAENRQRQTIGGIGATLEEAKKAWRDASIGFLRKSPSRIAYLGNGLGNAASNVIVPGQPNKVYARDSLNSANYYTVQNFAVQPAVNKPVVLGYVKHDPDTEQVLDFHYAGYEYNSAGASIISAPRKHGETHEFGGGDEVFIDSRLFTPGLLRPLDPPSMQAYVLPFVYYYKEWKRYPGGSVPDLTQYIPDSGSKYVLISVDPSTNDLVLRVGDPFAVGAAGTFVTVTGGLEAVPAPGDAEYPIGAINLSDTMTYIGWSSTDDSIFDARLHITPPWVGILNGIEATQRSLGNSTALPTIGVAEFPTGDFVANAWALRGREVNPIQPSYGQALAWNGSWWSPSTLAGVGEVNTGANIGTGIEVFREKSAATLNFRTLVAGTNVTISSATSTVTINSTGGGGDVIDAANLGTGIEVFREKSASVLDFRTLVAGDNVSISSATSTITINSTAGGGDISEGANVGTGVEVFREKSGASLVFRTIIGGTNVTATSSTSAITINSTAGGGDISEGANIGTGVEVFREKSGASLVFRTIIGGDNITTTSSTSAVTISALNSSQAATNLGDGIGVYKETAANTHQFKTLAATGNTTLASNASIITISSTDTSNSAVNLGTGIEVFKETFGNQHQFRTLVAGTNVTIGSAASTITIDSAYTDTSNSAVNLGTGIEVFKETFGNEHQFRTLVAGNNVTIGSSASVITIGSSYTDTSNSAINLGTGIEVFRETAGGNHQFRTLIAGTNVSISSATSTITIDSSYTDTSNSAVNLGTGVEIFKETFGNQHQFKTLAAGANITLASNASVVTISGASQSGEANTGTNLGTGIEIFREKSGVSLNFRTLVAGTNVTIGSSTSVVTINSAYTDTSNSAVNLGTGIGVFKETFGNQHQFKTLVSGDNITLASAASTITISSTDTSNTGENLGTGIGVFRELSGTSLLFKTLAGGGNTTIGSSASVITISSTDTSNSATNLGTGIGIFKETFGNQHQFKTLVAGTNVTIGSAASTVTINSSYTDTSNSAANIGTGIEVFRETTGNLHQFRTLVGGTNVTISSATSTVTINSSYTDTSNSATNLGLGIGVFKETALGQHQFKTLAAGANITLASNASVVTISGASQSGEANTGANLGTGIEIFREKSGVALNFRTLVGGTNVSIASSTSIVTINSSYTDTSNSATNLGTGIGVFKETAGNQHQFKTLAAGDNITLASTASTITITGTDTSNTGENLGTGIGIFREVSGASLLFKTLAGGGNTTIGSSASVVTISSTDTSNSATNLGTGIEVFKETFGNQHQFKTLVAGTNVTIGSAASTVTINSSYTDTSNSATNLGTGIEIFKETAGNLHQFKTIVAGTNVTISSAASTVTIDSSYTDTSNSATNLGLGIGVFKETAVGQHQFKTLAAGANITLASNASVITISGASQSGEANTGTNLGTGIEVFREKSGVSLNFRTLVAGTNVTIGSSTSVITISSSYTDTSNSATNIGTGIGVFHETVANEHQFKTLVAGTNISLASAASTITINSTNQDDVINAANLGTGIEAFREKSASILNFRTFVAGNNVTISSAASTITIDSSYTDTSNSALNLGTGIGVFKETAGNQHQFKTLVGGTNITLSSAASTITITGATADNFVSDGANLGTGIEVFRERSASNLNFRTLIAGTNITITSATSTVTVNSSYTDTSNSATNLGTGVGVFKETAGNQHQFKTLVGGANVTIGSGASTVTINSSYTDTSNSAANIGTGIGVFHETVGNQHQFKTLVAGTNITIASAASTITINSTNEDDVIDAANLGTGIGTFREKSASILNFKSLVAGNNVTIGSATSTITINSSYTDTSNSAINLGTGIAVFKETVGNEHRFKTLVGGTNITISSATSTVTITGATAEGFVSDGANIGTGIEVYREKSASVLNFRTIVAGANVGVSSATSTITISSTDTSNSATNLGTGIGVFKETGGNTHQFKSLVAGTNVTISSATSTVTINSSYTDTSNSAINLGTGIGVFKETAVGSHQFKTLVAGTNISIASATSTITITNTNQDDVTNAANLGTGIQVFREKSASVLNFRTLVAGNNVTIGSAASTITITSTDTKASATNLGTGIGVFKETGTNTHQFKSLVAGTNVSIGSATSTITINSIGQVKNGANIGTGIPVYRENSASTLNFRTLVAGANMTVSSATSTVTVSSVGQIKEAENLGTGIQAYRSKSASTLQFRTLVAGTNVNISSATSTITITSTDTTTSAVNLGTGIEVFKETGGNQHQFKTLVAGTNVTIGSAASTVTINSSYTDTSNSATNLGTGIGVFKETAGGQHQFKSLVAGTNITIASAASTVTITGTAAEGFVSDAANLGTGIPVYREKSASVLNFRTIIPGTYTTVSSATSTVTVDILASSNPGTAACILASDSTGALQLQRIGLGTIGPATPAIPITTRFAGDPTAGGQQIRLEYSASKAGVIGVDSNGIMSLGNAGEFHVAIDDHYSTGSVRIKNAFTGSTLFSVAPNGDTILNGAISIGASDVAGQALNTLVITSETPNQLTLRHSAGKEATFTVSSAGNLSIGNTGTITEIYGLDYTKNAANLGTGIEVYREKSASVLNFRTLVAGNNVTISSATSTITVASVDTKTSAVNLGTGIGVFKETGTNTHQFKTLVAGNNVTISSATSTVTINSSYTDTSNSATNLGTGIGVFKETAGGQHQFRTLVAGTYTTVASAASTVTVDVTLTGYDFSGEDFSFLAGDGIAWDGGNLELDIDLTDDAAWSPLAGDGIAWDSTNNTFDIDRTDDTLWSAFAGDGIVWDATNNTFDLDSGTAGPGLAYAAGVLSIDRTYDDMWQTFAGDGITWDTTNDTFDIDLATNSGLTLTSGELLLGTPTTLTVSTSNSVLGSTHSHAITTDTNPTGAAILATDSSGFLTIQGLRVGDTSTATDNDIYAVADIQAGNDLIATGQLWINETANANQTTGITIHAGSATDEVITFKGTNVAHGITAQTETDTWGYIKIGTGAVGGMDIRGFTETNQGLLLQALVTTGDTTQTATSVGGIRMRTHKKTSTTITWMGATENLLTIDNYSSTRFIFQGDGELFMETVGTSSPGYVSTFDDYDDIALLTGFRGSLFPVEHELRKRFAEFVDYARPVLEAARVVTYNDGPDGDGSIFVGMRGLQMLTIDALRQFHNNQMEINRRLQKQIEAQQLEISFFKKALLNAGINPEGLSE